MCFARASRAIICVGVVGALGFYAIRPISARAQPAAVLHNRTLSGPLHTWAPNRKASAQPRDLETSSCGPETHSRAPERTRKCSELNPTR